MGPLHRVILVSLDNVANDVKEREADGARDGLKGGGADRVTF